MSEIDDKTKLLIGMASTLVFIGIWVGTMQYTINQLRAETTDIWTKYNEAIEREKTFEVHGAVLENRVKQLEKKHE